MKHLLISFITLSICWVFYCILQLDSATTATKKVEDTIELTTRKDLPAEDVYQPVEADGRQNQVATSLIRL